MMQFLRFSAVGLVNTAIGLICIWGAMYALGLNEIAANFLGYAIGLLVSFALNRSWTFAHRGPISASLPRWLGLAAGAYLVNLTIVLAAHRGLGINPYLAQPLGIAAYTAIMFAGGRAFVFAAPGSRDTRLE